MVDGLVRRRATPILGGLGRKARERALRGAIALNARKASGMRGASVLLVDDVLTSGATTAACVRVLKRGGFTDVPSGAHMFRHSLATGLLRAGSTLDAIGTVLRHRSPESTAIYAKVDLPMLLEVAQPWPGDAAC